MNVSSSPNRIYFLGTMFSFLFCCVCPNAPKWNLSLTQKGAQKNDPERFQKRDENAPYSPLSNMWQSIARKNHKTTQITQQQKNNNPRKIT